MKEQNFDLYGNPIPQKRSNPTKMQYCYKKHRDEYGERTGEEHGVVKWTSSWRRSLQKYTYECSVCHYERTKKKHQKEMKQGGKISDKDRQAMFNNHRSKDLPCPDCGKREQQLEKYRAGNRNHVWNIDHIDPDGTDASENVRVVCHWCNKKKGDKKTHVVSSIGGVLDV